MDWATTDTAPQHHSHYDGGAGRRLANRCLATSVERSLQSIADTLRDLGPIRQIPAASHKLDVQTQMSPWFATQSQQETSLSPPQ